MRLFLTSLAATSLLALPGLAQAADGYVTCQVYQPNKNRVLYTQAFAADKADADALYEKFVSFLAANSYTTSMYSSEPAAVEGICNWETTADTANAKTEGFKATYESKGASTMGVSGFPE